jgi:hypothetical protein
LLGFEFRTLQRLSKVILEEFNGSQDFRLQPIEKSIISPFLFAQLCAQIVVMERDSMTVALSPTHLEQLFYQPDSSLAANVR